jgi:excisionase family DNA binding protein
MSDLLTKVEVARLLGGDASPSYVDKLLAARKLPRVRLSYKMTRIPRAAVEEFIRSRTIAAVTRP